MVQVNPAAVRPYPTVLRILNDAGMAGYPDEEIDVALARDQITMSGWPPQRCWRPPEAYMRVLWRSVRAPI